jgi:transcriptional regulator with XRE-family HTH domain
MLTNTVVHFREPYSHILVLERELVNLKVCGDAQFGNIAKNRRLCMCIIYNNIQELCRERGIKPGRMCTDIKISKSILTGLKNGTKKNIQSDTAQKIADYFGVPIDRILGKVDVAKSELVEKEKASGTAIAPEEIDRYFQMLTPENQAYVKSVIADKIREQLSEK